MAFIIQNIAPIMFASLIVLLLLGYPVAFSLAANGLVFGLLGMHYGLFAPTLLQALPERVLGVMSNDTLLAIPFFTFMGLILERSGMAEDLLDTVGQLLGPSVEGLPMRSCLSVRSLPLQPGWSPRRSSQWVLSRSRSCCAMATTGR